MQNIKPVSFKKLIYINALFLLLFAACNQGSSNKNNVPKDSIAQIEAVKTISKELESDANNAELYYNRAQIYFNQGYLTRAESDLTSAIQIDSLNPIYTFLLGRVYYAKNETKNAEKLYTTTLALKPDFNDVKLKLADLYYLVKEHKKSIGLLQELILSEPDNATLYHNLGMNFRELGDTSRAIYHFQTAVEHDAKDIESMLYIANLYAAQNNKIAIEYYNSVIKISPKNTDAFFGRAVFYQKLRIYQKALLDYRRVIDINPSFYKAYFNVGYLNFEIKNYKDAMRNWDIAIGMNDQYAAAYYMKGLVFEIQGNPKEAILNYKKALEADAQYTLAKEALQALSN